MKCNGINNDVSLVVTSCKRHDLLNKTLLSFVEFNTYPIEKVIIIEDSDNELPSKELRTIFSDSNCGLYDETDFVFINNRTNIGQMKSIDKAYSHVDSRYIFHCEDDWQFFKVGFIEASLRILDINDNIFTVWLRSYDDLNGHSVSNLKCESGISYRKIEPMKFWTGFTLNPGLRLTKNCMKFLPYSSIERLDTSLKGRTETSESDIAILYANNGYFGVVTSEVDGYVNHMGAGRHISNSWESYYLVFIKNTLRRLLNKIR
ncbi:glycosyltransferase [Vibrio tasmaniensis]|uniref:glycosyltransferase n=1 Tax=Vibrio tasmaniensis TaxID=212663 RepID=UPI001081349C|nr:glycosyltransferase [Vibrio tasmaniensis]